MKTSKNVEFLQKVATIRTLKTRYLYSFRLKKSCLYKFSAHGFKQTIIKKLRVGECFLALDRILNLVSR